MYEHKVWLGKIIPTKVYEKRTKSPPDIWEDLPIKLETSEGTLHVMEFGNSEKVLVALEVATYPDESFLTKMFSVGEKAKSLIPKYERILERLDVADLKGVLVDPEMVVLIDRYG